MEYKITHREKLVGRFYVEVDSPYEALEKYNRMLTNGELDFSDLELVESSDEVGRRSIKEYFDDEV